MNPVNEATITKLLSIVDQGLSSGLGVPKPGSMCVEAAVCYSLGLPHGDDPRCVDAAVRSLKICLNDGSWSSKTARAKGLRRLAVLQLGTKDNFDQAEFLRRVVVMTVNTVVADAIESRGLTKEADACRAATTVAESRAAAGAAADAARAAGAAARAADAAGAAGADAVWAADAVGAADAAWAAGVVARAARAAADAADARDETLQKFSDNVADILIDMKVPTTKYLYLLD